MGTLYEDWNMRVELRPKVWMLLGLCLLSGGLTVQAKSAAVQSRAGSSGATSADWLLCPELLDHARLKIVWQQALPLNPGETFAALTLLEDRLYLRSSRNYLWSLDASRGDVVFSRSVAPQGIPVLCLDCYGDTLVSVVGNRLTEFRDDTGTDVRVSNLGVSIVAPPVRNSQFFYVPGADRRLHVFRADYLVRTFKAAADDDSLITTVCADETEVVFGTATGSVMAMAADAPRKLWSFKAAGGIAGSVIREGDSFFLASKDTHVYRIDVTDTNTVQLTWRFQTEAVLDREPRVTERFVYQYATGRGVTAIDKQTGRAAWARPEGVDLLAEAGGKAYIITRVRTLAVMDNATGKRLYSVNCAPVTGHAANTENARIYVADGLGRVVCLEPTR